MPAAHLLRPPFGLTEASMTSMLAGGLPQVTRNLRAGEELVEGALIVFPQAVEPTTGNWHEGGMALACVTTQVLLLADLRTGQRLLEYDVTALESFTMRAGDDAILLRFTGVNPDLVQLIGLRLAGPSDGLRLCEAPCVVRSSKQ
jgi:hypothetical protein